MERETPHGDDFTMSSWRNQYDLSLKLATILAVSKHSSYIDDEMLATAQDLTENAVMWQKQLVPSILRGLKGSNEHSLLETIKERGMVKRSFLSKRALSRFNMKSIELDQIIRTWVDAGLIVEVRKPRSQGGISYVSTGK